MFAPAHVENHHAFCNTTSDYNYTWKHKDDNSLVGFIMHPFSASIMLLKLIPSYLDKLYREDMRSFCYACSQYVFIFFYFGLVLYLDIYKSIVFIFIPQLISLFYLLGSNYLQHAHTDETCKYNNSRNFLGAMNKILFNTGYHTAHHLQPQLHWSQLPAAHREIEKFITPELKQKSLVIYIVRNYLWPVINKEYASKSLRKITH